jgi:hypothetical protein
MIAAIWFALHGNAAISGMHVESIQAAEGGSFVPLFEKNVNISSA